MKKIIVNNFFKLQRVLLFSASGLLLPLQSYSDSCTDFSGKYIVDSGCSGFCMPGSGSGNCLKSGETFEIAQEACEVVRFSSPEHPDQNSFEIIGKNNGTNSHWTTIKDRSLTTIDRFRGEFETLLIASQWNLPFQIKRRFVMSANGDLSYSARSTSVEVFFVTVLPVFAEFPETFAQCHLRKVLQ